MHHYIAPFFSRRNAFLAFVVFFTNISNLAFQILVARILTVSEYGDFISIWAFYGVISIAVLGIQNKSAVISAQLNISEERYFEKYILDSFTKKIIIVSAILGILLGTIFFLTNNISNQHLAISSLVGLIVPLMSMTAVSLGKLQGFRNIAMYLYAQFLLSTSKILILLPLTFVKAKVFFLILFIDIKQLIIGVAITIKSKGVKKFDSNIIDRHTIHIILSTSAVWSLVFLDLTLVKFHLGDVSSGIYSASSNLLKINIYGALITSQFLIPYIARREKLDGSAEGSLKVLLLTTLILSVLVLTTIIAFGQFFMTYLYGSQYYPGQETLMKLGFITLIQTMLIIAFSYKITSISIFQTQLLLLLVLVYLIVNGQNTLSLNWFLITNGCTALIALTICLMRRRVLDTRYFKK